MDLVNTEYGEVMHSLQQGHFAMLIFWFYTIAGIIIASCIFELVYRCDRKFFPMVVLCPASIFVVIVLRFERYRALCFFLIAYILILLLADRLTVGDTEYGTLQLLCMVGFWPIYVIEFLLKNFNGMLFFQEYYYKFIGKLK